MGFVNTNGIRMYYETMGTGEPLLLIMGLGGGSSQWYPPFLDALSRDFFLIVNDNRGTGRSDKPDVRYGIGDFADDLAGLLDSLDIQRTHVFGVSMGGMIAQELALQYPARINKLIFACTTAGGPKAVQATPEVLETLRHPGGSTPEEMARNTWPIVFTPKTIREREGDLLERFRRAMEYPTPPSSFRRHLLAVQHHNTHDRLSQILAPTLVMTGEEDILVPPENSRILADGIPGAYLRTFANAAHGFILEAMDEVVRAVVDFLRV